MPRYADDSKEKVRDAVDFVDLVGRYTELRRAGPGSFKALCPFHEERSPSFSVDGERKLYHCFGCQEAGDVFSFVMAKEGLDFVGALEWLADRYGVELEVADEDPGAAERRKARGRLLELLDRTATYYARVLWQSDEAEPAREYLASRGLEEALLREFRVGFAPAGWDTVMLASRRAGFSNRELYDAGLVQRGREGRIYDRFRRRIVFPLCDRRGNVLGFGARRMGEGEGPKYLNSPDSPLFHKRDHVYAADIARAQAARSGEVILAEGYTDVIALHQIGLRNAVGVMGTAFTDHQVLEIGRLAPRALLAFDADSAGQEAALRAATVAEGKGVELRVVPLPVGLDPADLVQQQGAAAVRELVERSVPFVEFRVERALAVEDLSGPEGRDRAIGAVAPVLGAMPMSVLRDELVRRVADRVDLAPERLWQMVEQRKGQRPPQAGAGRPAPQSGDASGSNGSPAQPVAAVPARAPLDPLAHAERNFLATCVALPAAGAELLDQNDPDELFASPLHRRAAAHLRGHVEAPEMGIPDDDPELASVMAELLVRARTEVTNPTRAGLAAEMARLRVTMIDRAIREARRSGEGGVADLMAQKVELKRQIDAGAEDFS